MIMKPTTVNRQTIIWPSPGTLFLSVMVDSGVRVHVITRIRPLHKGERKRSVKRVVKVVDSGDSDSENEGNAVVNVAIPSSSSKASVGSITSIPSAGLRGGGRKAGMTTYKQYSPSLALAPLCSQQEVFERSNIRALVGHSMRGYRATMFAYGQTGAGKSYTVIGEDRKPGLLYRGVNHLFKECAAEPNVKYTIRVSAIELYNEQCFDMLQTTTRARLAPLQIREHESQGFYVDRLTGVRCPNVQQCISSIRHAVAQRTVGGHQMNERSSRSHLMVTLYVDGIPVDAARTFGRLCFVDLAGSERLKHTRSSNAKESGFINKSLYTLGKVINGIANSGGTLTRRNNRKVPFRESILTKLLISSLGGNTMCTMVACVSCGGDALGETMRTLGFAMKAKGIVNHPNIHVDEQEQLVSNLKREIEKLKKENLQLKHMVIEVSQEASLASSKGVGSNHIGLVNDIEQLVGETGFDFADVDMEFFGLDEEEGIEEVSELEDEDEDEDEEKDQEYKEEEDFDEDYFSENYEDDDDFNDEEKEQEEEKEEYGSDDQDDSPNIFGTKEAKQQLSTDPEQRIVELQLMIVEAKAKVVGEGGRVSRQIIQLEEELEDLQNELRLTAQLNNLGLEGEEEKEAGTEEEIDEEEEEEQEREDEQKARALQQMIQDTVDSAVKTPESGIYGEEGGGDNDSEEEAKLSPTGFGFEEDELGNWREMWENSLKILASDDFSGPQGGEKLKVLERLDEKPPVKKLFAGRGRGRGSGRGGGRGGGRAALRGGGKKLGARQGGAQGRKKNSAIKSAYNASAY